MSITDFFNKIPAPIWLYAFWILLHFVVPHLYVYFCTPATILGFIASPFVAPAPHCSAFRWVIYNGGNTITSMWVVLGGWLLQKLIFPTTVSTVTDKSS